MKTIKKIKESSKAVAGTALLVGATIAGGAAMVSASSHSGSSGSGDLGDYPHPFVNDDGEIASTLVMGEDAKATDVVAATQIAGQLGNDASTTETQSVDVSGSFGWSADGGTTLDTRNDQLYFGDSLDTVRETLTQDDLDFLSETEFQDDSGTTTDITSYLNVGEKTVSFGNDVDGLDNEDPVLHVPVPTEGDVDNEDYLVNLQANFGDSLDFSEEDVQGEEIELFGKTYTVSQDDNEDTDSELVLYGSSEEVTVETGESTTVTINGEEHTLEVVSVNAGGEEDGNAAIRVDGNLRSEDTDATFNVDGQQVRVDQIIKTGGSESSSGVVQFAIGSEELVLSDSNAIEDEDGDEIEGTYVTFNGDSGLSDSLDDGISSIDLYLGAEDDDSDYLAAGDSWSHSMFEDVEVHFGGLNPDASEEGDTVGQVEVSTSGDDTATVDITGDNGDSANVEFAYYDEEDDQEVELADSDGDEIVGSEGEPLYEDEYFTSDAGDFAHMWEVTGIDIDGADSTVDIRDAVTGQSVELEAEEQGSDIASGDVATYFGTEIVDGQKYVFRINEWTDNSGHEPTVNINWGDGAQYNTDTGQINSGGGGWDYSTADVPGATSLYTAVDTDSGAAVSLMDRVDFGSYSLGSPEVFEFPSTESTDNLEVRFEDGDSTDVDVDTGNDGTVDTSINDGSEGTFTVGSITYRASIDADGNLEWIQPDESGNNPAVAVIEPEDDSDNENAYISTPNYDSSDDEEIEINDAIYTGSGEDRQEQTLESDDDVEAGYDIFGAYSEYDSDGQGEFTLNIPDGQSTAGAAVTGAEGGLSAEAGASGTVESQMPTGWPAQSVALDSDDYISQVQDNRNLILVGGPAANGLVQDLADMNKTWSTSDYTEGEGLLQLVPEAFNDEHDALVVAGYTGEDTRAAGDFLSNYGDHQEALDGETQVSIDTASGSVVE